MGDGVDENGRGICWTPSQLARYAEDKDPTPEKPERVTGVDFDEERAPGYLARWILERGQPMSLWEAQMGIRLAARFLPPGTHRAWYSVRWIDRAGVGEWDGVWTFPGLKGTGEGPGPEHSLEHRVQGLLEAAEELSPVVRAGALRIADLERLARVLNL